MKNWSAQFKPITEEVLEKFGFKSDAFGFWRLKRLDIIFSHTGECWFCFLDNKYLSGEAPERRINYVHQLQNLWFLITGEELEYRRN